MADKYPTPKLSLDLKAQQQLIMTPQLREAIGLLQLTNIELSGYLENELAENPFLEKDEADLNAQNPDSPDTSDSDTPDSHTPDKDTPEGAPDFEPDSMESNFNPDDGTDTGPDASFDEAGFDKGSDWATTGKGGSTSFDDDENPYTQNLTAQRTLRDHLTEQLLIETNKTHERLIGTLLIDRLDEAGYLREDPADLATQLGCEPSMVDNLLTRMRRFDPPGIFARDLADCLGLQLADRNRLDPAMQICLQNLPKIAEGDLKGLARLCGVDLEDVTDMIREIRELNPKPASPFEHVIAQTALPDVLMRPLPKHLGGGWRVELNHDTLPRVLVNQDYANIVLNAKMGKDDKKYLNDRLASASWLVRALDQRAQTILKVASAIIEHQDGFFLFGVEFLKPLTLREIAEEVGVHESTVSRVTMGKFIGTPRGLFELKYFFDSGVSASSGTSLAAEAIKAKIKTMIDAEDLSNILSDDEIATRLKSEGIDIARRTVAKYREAANIGSSAERRRIAKNKAALGS